MFSTHTRWALSNFHGPAEKYMSRRWSSYDHVVRSFEIFVVPENPADALTPLTLGYDHPSPLRDQLDWLREAGFVRRLVTWSSRDLAVVVADAPPADIVATQ